MNLTSLLVFEMSDPVPESGLAQKNGRAPTSVLTTSVPTSLTTFVEGKE